MKLAFTTGLLCLAGIAASAQAAPVKIGPVSYTHLRAHET